jgi:hypothetical protein
MGAGVGAGCMGSASPRRARGRQPWPWAPTRACARRHKQPPPASLLHRQLPRRRAAAGMYYERELANPMANATNYLQILLRGRAGGTRCMLSILHHRTDAGDMVPSARGRWLCVSSGTLCRCMWVALRLFAMPARGTTTPAA